MVGGTVGGIRVLEDRIWVNCWDKPYKHIEECAIYVERNADSEQIKIGDSLWWQGRFALWTPRPEDGRHDVEIPRIGYSGVPDPKEAPTDAR